MRPQADPPSLLPSLDKNLAPRKECCARAFHARCNHQLMVNAQCSKMRLSEGRAELVRAMPSVSILGEANELKPNLPSINNIKSLLLGFAVQTTTIKRVIHPISRSRRNLISRDRLNSRHRTHTVHGKESLFDIDRRRTIRLQTYSVEV